RLVLTRTCNQPTLLKRSFRARASNPLNLSLSINVRRSAGKAKPSVHGRDRNARASAAFRGWRLLLSFGAGLALAFAFPNYNLPVLGWVSVAGLILASIGAGLAEAALCGFLY